MTQRLPLIAISCAAAISMLLAACSADIFTRDPGEGLALSSTVAFTLTDGQGTSRGVPVDDISKLKDFRADAYLHRNGNKTRYFSDERQYAVLDSGVYRCDNGYLWPSEPGDRMSFVAVAPYNAVQGVTISPEGDFTYTVPDSAVTQCDLMFAQADDVECPEPGTLGREPVPLNLRHILTQVRFVFGANEGNYWRKLTVHSIRVENVSTTGTWNATDGVWEDLDNPTHAYEIVSAPGSPGDGVKPHNSGETEIWDNQEKKYTMFLMPQTLPTDARVAVDMSFIPSESLPIGDTIRAHHTYHLYLDGKQLLPGHTVIVEINSNFTDMVIANPDFTEYEPRPLSANAQELPLRLLRNGGGDVVSAHVAPECRSFASLSSDPRANPDSVCDISGLFTLHVTENTSPSDRFIRLVFHEGHDATPHWSDHIVVLKQRGVKSAYGSFTDDPSYVDSLQPWGFNWPRPFKVVFNYDNSFWLDLDFSACSNYLTQWVSKGTNGIILDLDILRDLARQPNSPSDGLANTQAINSYCRYIKPLNLVNLFYEGLLSDFDNMTVNGTELGIQQFEADYGSYNDNAVMKTVCLNHIEIPVGGFRHGDFVRTDNIKTYLPAIEQLETIAGSNSSPLVPGRTYWSSTVDTDGEPVALTVNADGSYARCKPGAGSQAYVHPVKVVQ